MAFRYRMLQCCGSGMFYPGSDHCSIPDPEYLLTCYLRLSPPWPSWSAGRTLLASVLYQGFPRLMKLLAALFMGSPLVSGMPL
jgi:hypothetical protein